MSLKEVGGLPFLAQIRCAYPHLLDGTLMVCRPLPFLGGYMGSPLRCHHHEVTYPRHERHLHSRDRARRKPKPVRKETR